MRALVAGIGNIFFGDDGFGSEVAKSLLAQETPREATILDVGIRGLHLAYELLEDWDLLIVADAASMGKRPGTVCVIEPRFDQPPVGGSAHGMDLSQVVSTARSLGARLPEIRLVGCEPERLGEGIGLSPAVRAAVPVATTAILDLLREGRTLVSEHLPRDAALGETRSLRKGEET